MLTESRKADRAQMADMVEALCAEMGAKVTREEGADYPGPQAIHLEIELGNARVGIEFDGGPFNTQKNCFCMPWNTAWGSTAKMSEAFGTAVGGDVNPHHRAKCMAFAQGIDALLIRLRSAMECIRRGDAFEVQASPRGAVGSISAELG